MTYTLRAESYAAFKIIKYLLKNKQKVSIPFSLNLDKIKDNDLRKEFWHLSFLIFHRDLLHGKQYISPHLEIDFYNAKPPLNSPNPIYISGGKVYTISAFQIIEGHARCCEIDHSILLKELHKLDFNEWLKIFEETSIIDPYELVLQMVSETLGGDYFKVLTIAETCCDIALNPDLHNGPDTQQWEDIHPGWRFIHILELLKKLKIRKNDFNNPDKIGEMICEELNWARPIDALSKWLGGDPFLKIYDNDVKLMRSEMPFMLGDVSMYLNEIAKTFPLNHGALGLDNLDSESKLRQKYSRDYFKFLRHILSFLLGARFFTIKERKDLLKMSKILRMDEEFDLDNFFNNCEFNKISK